MPVSAFSILFQRSSGGAGELTPKNGTLFVFFTGGIVFLTLIINGSTTQFILHLLNMDKLSATKKRILDFTKYEMLNKALETFGDLGDDEELGPADWQTVKRYITCLNDVDGEPIHPHTVPGTDSGLDSMDLKDTRIRFLNGVQAAYWGLLDEGRITQTTANILMQSVDEALDLVENEPLCDWKGLRANVHFPSYYKYLQSRMFPQKLVTYFVVERLESACYKCAAFLRAHRIARQQLHDFLGGSNVASAVIDESEAEGEEARKFLEEVHLTFPQVLRVVKTRQVTHSVLSHLIDYVQDLERVGLLEQKEMLHLHDAVQTDLKRLLRNPPLAKIRKINDLSAHPMWGALPSAVRDLLATSTRETMKMRGSILYKEGSRPNGIWLISSGVVKWSSNRIRNKHSLHPTFTHGSTLGLYEVLAGKPYICDIVTDSVVLCFFVESQKILSALKSDPSVEDFLWQESAIFLAKFLLPHIFEKRTMQELRSVVAERSMMNVYVREEMIEIPPHSIGFLMDGYVKRQIASELITSPAPLLPAHYSASFLNLSSLDIKQSSFSHQGSSYRAESRARVIVYDMAAFESGTNLLRRSSSLLQQSIDHPHRSFREHGGLMSWPEQLYQPKQLEEKPKGVRLPGSQSLSAKAMQLSIFGSMVDARWQSRSSSSILARPPPYSLSCPTVPPYDPHLLVSATSEGPRMCETTLEAKEPVRTRTKPPVPKRKSHGVDDSSGESGDEEELIVRIDSPSRLSFQQGS